MRIVLLLAMICFVACSDDETPATTDTGRQSDTGDDVRGTTDAGRDVTVDMRRADTSKDVSTDTTQDTTQDVATDAQDLSFPDVESQPCTHPSTDPNCPPGDFGPATFLNQIEVVLDGTCCRDMTGDGVIDNRMGTILAAVVTLGVDINQDIANEIQRGSLVYLIEFANWENETFDPTLDATLYLGADETPDFSDNLNGTGSFWVTDESFDEVTGDPISVFENSQVLAGKLNSQRGVIDLKFPGLLPEVEIITTDLLLTADVDPNAVLASGGRVTITNGELSGAIDRGRFFESLNLAATGCGCIGRPIFTPIDAGDYDCNLTAVEEMMCQTDPESGCRLMGRKSTCSLWGQLGSSADVDTNNDGDTDAFSIGLRVSGVGASILGREPQ